MALLWADGFEKYGTVNSAINPTDIITWKYLGRFGEHINVVPGATVGDAIRFDHTAIWMETPQFNVPEGAALICGFAFKFTYADKDGAWIVDFRQPNGFGQVVSLNMMGLYVDTSNSVNEVAMMVGGTKVASSNAAGVDLQNDTWYYIEIKATCDASSGICQVKLNGNTIIDFTGDTRYFKSAYPLFNRLAWRNHKLSYIHIDDLYICDNTGNTNNDFLGTVNVHTLSPASDVSGNWTPSTGNDFYAVTDEDQQGSDYISDTVSGNQVLMELGNLPSGGTIAGVAITVDSEVSGNLSKYAKLITQNGASGSPSVTGNCVPGIEDNPIGHVHPMDYDSDDNGWTAATVNSLRVGVEVS